MSSDYGEVLIDQSSAGGIRVVIRPDLRAKCWVLEYYLPNNKGKTPKKKQRWYPAFDQVVQAAGEMLLLDLPKQAGLTALQNLAKVTGEAVKQAAKYAEGNRLLKANPIGPASRPIPTQ